MNNILIAVLILVILGGGWWAFNQDPGPVSTNGDVNIFDTDSEVTENTPETPDTTNENPGLSVSNDKVLDLSNQGLTSVPQSVFLNKNATELNLANNALSGALPGEIRFFENLKVLNLSNNQFTGVPAEIGQLKNLEVLDLSNNKITGLPNELGNLRNLKILKLTGNQYSTADLEGIKKNLPSSVVIETN